MPRSKRSLEQRMSEQEERIKREQQKLREMRVQANREARKARTRRLIMVGGEVEARVGRDLSKDEARFVGNVACAVLSLGEGSLGALSDGRDRHAMWMELTKSAAHAGELSYQRRKTKEAVGK